MTFRMICPQSTDVSRTRLKTIKILKAISLEINGFTNVC